MPNNNNNNAERPFSGKYKQGVNRYYKGNPVTFEVDSLLDVYGGIKVRAFSSYSLKAKL